ncbi:hypothetical protein SynSYN20_01519 [Synechococcus sp. SYN20]|nr:hypothetical protein SynSYN20_01519 [Synechococcus sp. SYN20]
MSSAGGLPTVGLHLFCSLRVNDFYLLGPIDQRLISVVASKL